MPWGSWAPSIKKGHKVSFFKKNSLFGDKSIWYRCIQDVKITFASTRNVNRHTWQSNSQSECQRVLWSWAFQDIFIHDIKSVFICYIHILKYPWNLIIHLSRIFMRVIPCQWGTAMSPILLDFDQILLICSNL